MEMFGNYDFGSMFGSEYSITEEQKPKKEKKKKETVNKNTKATKSTPELQRKIKLPCKVIAGSFSCVIEGDEEVTLEALIDKIKETGFDEIRLADVRAIYCPKEYAGTVYVVSKISIPLGDDTLLDLENDLKFVYGEQKLNFSKEDFSDTEEPTVLELKEKIYEAFPEFKGMDVFYDISTNLATIMADKQPALKDGDIISFPLNVNVCGERRMVMEEDLDGTTVKDVVAYLTGEFSHPDVTCMLVGNAECYLLCLHAKGVSVSSAAKTSKNKKAKKKEPKYPSNAIVYIVINGYHEQLKSENFEGKEKITKQDLIDYFKGKFAIFSSAEKTGNMKLYYDELQNRLSITFEPGTRGSAYGSRRYDRSWDYEEREHYVSTEDGHDPMEDVIFLKEEFNNVLTNPMSVCFNKEILANSILPYGGCKIFANNVAAYIYRNEKGANHLEKVSYKLPSIPRRVYDAIITYFKGELPNEAIIQVIYDHRHNNFILQRPEHVDATPVSVTSTFPVWSNPYLSLVATIHSHANMEPFFSPTDDSAEMDQIGIFGVIGRLGSDNPQMLLRAVYEGGQKFLMNSVLFDLSKK